MPGPSLPIPVIDLILHPPIGLLQRELIVGALSGSGDLTRNTGQLAPFNNVNAYGLAWTFFTVPAAFGRTAGSPVIYDERMIQLSAVYSDFGGHDFIGEYHSFFAEGIYWLWDTAGPTRIHYEIAVGVVVTAYWLTVHT